VIDYCGNDQHCMFHMCGSERDSSRSLEALFSSMLGFHEQWKREAAVACVHVAHSQVIICYTSNT